MIVVKGNTKLRTTNMFYKIDVASEKSQIFNKNSPLTKTEILLLKYRALSQGVVLVGKVIAMQV